MISNGEAERFFQAILELSNSSIVIADARADDAPIVFVNRAFERLTGYREEEVVGKNCRFLQNDDHDQPGCIALREALRTGDSCEVIIRNYTKAGRLFWVKVDMFPVHDEDNTITHFISLQHDVSAEVESLRMLKEQRALIDTSPEIYMRISSDLTILDVNESCKTMSGWSTEELIGKNAANFLPASCLDAAKMKVEALVNQGKSSRCIAEYLTKTGQPLVLEWSAVVSEYHTHVLLVGRDITAKQAAERDATRANAHVLAILSSIAEGCLTLDRDWTCKYMNEKAGQWLNKKPEEVIGRNIWHVFPESVGGPFYETYNEAMGKHQFAQCEAFCDPVGKWLEARAYPSDQGITVFFLDISERKAHELALVYSATHDALTGLPNRNSCLEILDTRLNARAVSGESLAVLFIDLDRFKEINDAFGHAAGDHVLTQIGKRLSCFASESCFPSRISGDEFVMIVCCATENHIKALASKVLDSVATPIQVEGRVVTIGASIGISMACSGLMTADDLLTQADTAMYLSKSNGRHTFTFFNTEVDQWNLRRHQLRQHMLQAMHEGQFILHYQPQVSLVDNQVVGAEALIRWQHPEFGMLSPAVFIEIAEESPLIIELGAWVFNEACRQLMSWQHLGHFLQISINVSARQLSNRDMPEMMTQGVLRHSISPNQIKLEVTESMLAQDFDAATEVLDSLKRKGFRIALDDFGAGYSNLSYISRLPVTEIKIDRSFVTGLTIDKSALSLIKGIVALAKSLDLTVICEGIETVEQRELLKDTQCDTIQGYLIGKPVSPADFYERFLTNQSVPITQAH